LAGSGRGLPTGTSIRVGRVFTRESIYEIPVVADSIPIANTDTHTANVLFERALQPDTRMDQDSFADDDSPDNSGPSTEYIIGRISAWVCTTLYLTSRLPQIWKNFARKSVEGLSILLFVFAFLGNFFYVASILTSPKLSLPPHESSAFLRESIPYLLGSGGTLMFDITIVAQSFIYRPKSSLRGRHLSRTVNEEEQGLLSAGATGADDPNTPSRRRLPLSSASTERSE